MALWKKGKNPQDAQKKSQDWEELSFEDGEFEDEEYADEGGEVPEAEYADADGDVTEAEYADGNEAESVVGEEDFDLIFTDEDFAENLADDTAERLTDNTADSFADETSESLSDQRAGSYEVNAAAFGNITRKEGFVITGEPSGENMDTEEPDEEEVLTEEAYEEESYAGEAYEEEGYAGEVYDEEDYAGEVYDEEDYAGEAYAEEPYAEEPYAGELYAEEPYTTEAPVSQEGEDHFSDGLRIMDLDGQEDEEEEDDSFGAFFTKFVSGRMLAIASFLVLAVFIVAAAVIVTGRGSQSVDAFSTVSSDLEDVDVIGGEALAALMASKDEEYQATLLASEQTETTVSKEYEETETTTEKITVKLVMTSVEKDLKIKFTNASTGKLIANIPFQVKVSDGNGNVLTWTNDDKDGIIYKSGLTAGTYKVALLELEGELYENYDFSDSGTVTVKDTIVYEQVDVSAEIKEESEINVAAEEAQVVLEVESVNTDTVEWVESTKTLTGEEYTLIDKSLIAVPTASSVTRSFLATAITNNTSSLTLEEGESASVDASSDVDGAVLTYESSDESVAIVSEDGIVTAVAEGSAVITITETVTNEDGSTAETTQTCSVTVSAAEEEETSSTTAVTAAVAATATVSDTTTTETETAETESETTTTQTETAETESGTTTTASESTTTASESTTTTTADSTTATTTAKTYADFTLSVSASSLTLTKGATGTVSVTATGATEGETLTYEYTSSDTGVATVSGSGNSATVTAVSAGTATISIKAYYTDETDVFAETTRTVTVSTDYSDFTLSLSVSELSLNKNGSETVTVTPQNATDGENLTYTYSSSNTAVAEVYGDDNTVTVKGVGAGSATITVSTCYTNSTSKTASATFAVTVTSSSTALKTTDGRAVYVLENGSYRAATYDDYYTDGMAFYVKSEGYTYTGWQTIDGKTYYYTAAGNYVVGDQVILGVQYTFSSTGVLQDGSGTLGIDVSSHNGSIDWTAVKNSGVSYVIIRCGYRGYGSGVLVEDSRFSSNIQGAINAGLKVGVYFFSQAVTTTEAVEEASMVLQLISGYSISLPVYIDVEYSNSACDGRADSLSVSDRTAIVKAFCQTIQNSGYTAGIYANQTFLTSKLDMSQLSSYRVWLAQYAATPTYTGSYHMWQYTSSGSISGVSGNVDLNLWYY